MRLTRFLATFAVIPMLAINCGGDDGDGGPDTTDNTINPDGAHYQYVIDGVRMPAEATEAQELAVDLDGNVFFSDIQNNRIMKLAASGELSVFRADSGRANGNMFDREGRLVHDTVTFELLRTVRCDRHLGTGQRIGRCRHGVLGRCCGCCVVSAGTCRGEQHHDDGERHECGATPTS